MDDTVTVPVLINFDYDRPIGWLKIRKDALPPLPDFVFSIGFMAKAYSGVPLGECPTLRHVTEYELKSVSLTTDASYIEFLRKEGKLPPALAPLHTADEDGAMNCACDHANCPAASMCERCPRKAKAVEHDLACWAAVMELTNGDMSSVRITSKKRNTRDDKPMFIVVCEGGFTRGQDWPYAGDTYRQALESAVAAKRELEAKNGG